MVAIPGETISQKKVIVRTRNAGVHHGYLVEVEDNMVKLTDARRIWRWRGAYTLNEVCTEGIEPASRGHSRVASPVSFIYLNEWSEILPCTDKATKSIEDCGWAT